MSKINYKTIVLSVLVLTAFFVFSPQDAFAGNLTKNVSPPSDVLTYRDITDTTLTANPTLSLDKQEYRLHEIATLTLNDTNANLDIANIDFAFANISGSSITLTETSVNSNVFNGTFVAEDDIFVEYTSDSPEAVRAKITLPTSSAGNIELSDVSFDETTLNNIGIKPVTGAINIKLVNGAIMSGLPTVEISYGNANLDNGTINNRDLEMWYKAPSQSWEKITDSCNTRLALFLTCDFRDNTAKTITSDPSGVGFSGTDGQGSYVLALNTGISGGGGGGLVRPSLVVNALAGIGGGAGGGSAYSAPQIQLSNLVLLDWIDVPLEIEEIVVNHDSTVPATSYDLGYFDDFEDYPLTIDDKGFVLSGFTTTLETQTLKTNTTHTIKFMVYESEIIQHFSLYTNLRDTVDEIHESDTQILYNANQDLQLVDPNGFFENVSLTVNDLEDNKKEVVLEITFAKEMETSHIIARAWDPNLYSGDVHILDAWEIVSDVVVESPFTTYPEPEIQQLTTQTIPIWIKSNAAWWSDEQISDDDFVAGLEYLITNGIITVPGVQVESNPATEIPYWIKNNAGWWADSLITDDDFTEAMQWLIENGVMQI